MTSTFASGISPWLRRPAQATAQQQLFCFPYAGGGASMYATWQAHLPGIDVAPVHLPGREARMAEPHHASLNDLVQALIPALAARTQRPYALFGYSMGALIAFEVAHCLRKLGQGPSVLIVAAKRPPHLPLPPPIAHLSDDDLINELVRCYRSPLLATPEGRELARVMLPTLRADIRSLEQHQHSSGARLTCPIVALSGAEDALATPSEMAEWSQYTNGPFIQHTLPGHHFFMSSESQAVMRLVKNALGMGG
jgi:medium-chain acyl-[acyl-carrier-protein] hydrolase